MIFCVVIIEEESRRFLLARLKKNSLINMFTQLITENHFGNQWNEIFHFCWCRLNVMKSQKQWKSYEQWTNNPFTITTCLQHVWISILYDFLDFLLLIAIIITRTERKDGKNCETADVRRRKWTFIRYKNKIAIWGWFLLLLGASFSLLMLLNV